MFGNKSSPLKSLMGMKVPWNEGSWERTLQGTKVPPMELSFLGTKVLWYESSSYRNKHRRLWPTVDGVYSGNWNFRTKELSFPEMKVP